MKHCLLKRMIPRSYMIWFGSTDFYNHFLKHSHLRIVLNLRELFTAGIAVHKFSLVLFARFNRHPGNNVWKSEKLLSMPERHENEEKSDIDYVLRNDHLESKLLSQFHWSWYHYLRIVLNLRELFRAGIAVHKFSLVLFARFNGRPGNNVWKSEKPLSMPEVERHENEEKSDIDHVLRYDHRIKTTQPISLILVSLFSEDNVLHVHVCIWWNYTYFWINQSNEIRAFRYFGTSGLATGSYSM